MTPALTAIPILLAVTLCYVALCAVAPFGRCRRCNGLGFDLTHTRRGTPRRGKDCRRCRATGRRLRLGRRLHNTAARVYRDTR